MNQWVKTAFICSSDSILKRTTMSTNDVGLATERVQCSTETDLQDLHCSTICQNILWKPISCQECETHFCSKCITKWLENHPNQCPLRCNSFVQRPCSKFIARLLAKLHIVCIYQPNGCNEVSFCFRVNNHS